MSNPYVGEIRMFGGNFAPLGWMFCDGQLVAISENPTLFNLIGTTYGGDGVNTFALPDLRGRLPVHPGPGIVQGQRAGVETVNLAANQIPAHSHAFGASTNPGTSVTPAGNVPAASPSLTAYRQASPTVPLSTSSIAGDGGGLSHSNLQPFLCVDFIISLFGIFPSQN